jgi:serine/threonine protein kinase
MLEATAEDTCIRIPEACMSSPSYGNPAEEIVLTSVDDLLDQWEQSRERGEPLTVDQFVAERCAGVSPSIIEEFRVKAQALQSMDAGLGRLNKNDTGTGITTGGDAIAHRQAESEFRPGAAPIPGYRLVSWLGDGGFGEVWKAVGPGDFHVALKLIRLRSHVGKAELEAIRLVKDIRHPHLLSLFGTWQTDRHLIIAMELADRTLLDRFHEATAQKLPGIPCGELLKYLGDAAEALDFLHEPRHAIGDGKRVSVVHRDIKPQNLLLVGGRVKVADFGLVKILEKSLVTQTHSMTAAYAAPERFEGKTAAQTDQYALAITYCELLTGRLPFTGDLLALMRAHLHKEPDLGMLSAGERPVVARALAKVAESRWPSCTAFVTALQAAVASPIPRVEINETKVLLTGKPGQQLRHELTLTGLVSVSAQSNQAWLTIGQAVHRDGLTIVPLLVRSVPSEPDKTLFARVHIRTNGGQAIEVQVGLRIEGQSGTAAQSGRGGRGGRYGGGERYSVVPNFGQLESS